MKAHECYHCKQWVEEGEAHDCWTTTEGALTRDLSEDLQDAYARLREAAVELGDQRIYASHHSIMFSRKACHFLVKPRQKHLEFWMFLGRAIKAPQIRKVVESSKVKRAHLIHIRHRDEVEAPLTDWMREAYELQDQLPKLKKASASAREPEGELRRDKSASARKKPARATARRPPRSASPRRRPKKR